MGEIGEWSGHTGCPSGQGPSGGKPTRRQSKQRPMIKQDALFRIMISFQCLLCLFGIGKYFRSYTQMKT